MEVGPMPTVLVVTGPSGAGKGTLIRELVERVPEIEVTVSATTRERRRGELHRSYKRGCWKRMSGWGRPFG